MRQGAHHSTIAGAHECGVLRLCEVAYRVRYVGYS